MHLRRLILILLLYLLTSCKLKVTSVTPMVPAISGTLRTATLTKVPSKDLIATAKLIPSSTPIPTRTITSTATARPTATATYPPTFTPATPLNQASDTYKLQKWSANKADLLIAHVASYLNAIENDPAYDGVYGFAGYIEEFWYLAFSEQEALLRFPNVPQVEIWQWDLGYNLALSYTYPESSDAPELPLYAKLIEQGLNSKQTTVDTLPSWFAAHEKRLSISITSTPPPHGYDSSNILKLGDTAYLWLIEKDNQFQAVGLMSSLFFYREVNSDFQLLDLTGDLFPELILKFGRSYCCGAITQIFIFDLSSGIPRRLSFIDSAGAHFNTFSDYESHISSLETENQSPGLLFKSTYANSLDNPCHVDQFSKYFWNGQEFELVETWYDILPPDQYENKELCQYAIDMASDRDELDVIVQTIKQMRYETNAFRDEFRFRLGEYYARIGNIDKARAIFSDLVSKPDTSEESMTQWVQAAQIFLDKLKTAEDYYKVCSQAAPCDLHYALQQLVENIEPGQFPLAIETLKSLGVPVKSSDFYDFDGLNDLDQWMTIRYPGQSQDEFWLLVKSSSKICAVFVSEVSRGIPLITSYDQVGSEMPIIEVTTPQRKILFSLGWLNLINRPFLALSNQTTSYEFIDYVKYNQALDAITNEVLSGVSPSIARDTLTKLQLTHGFDCKMYDLCDRYFYLLGLTYELADDELNAVKSYLHVWEGYPDSPYTIMVRSKIELAP